MTENNITPPLDLVLQWTSLSNEMEGNEVWMQMATQAAQWGYQQAVKELENYLEQQHVAAPSNNSPTNYYEKP
jgi:hypothetical protein